MQDSDGELRGLLALARGFDSAYLLFNSTVMSSDAQRFLALLEA